MRLWDQCMCEECKRKVGMMKTYRVASFVSVEYEIEAPVIAENEDEAMDIFNEILSEDPMGVARAGGAPVVVDYGAVDCWEVEE